MCWSGNFGTCRDSSLLRPQNMLLSHSLNDERSAPQMQSFLVGGGASSMALSTCSSTSITLLTCRSLPYILLLGPYTSVYYVTLLWLVGWFTVQGKNGVCVGKKVNCGPMLRMVPWVLPSPHGYLSRLWLCPPAGTSG